MRQLLNTLYVTTDGAWLHLEGETVVVKIDGEKRLQVPLHHLGAMVCIGQVGMSPALMARNAEDGRSTVWLGRNGHFQARVEGPTNGNILLRQAQFRQADDPQASLELARATVAAKLRNSRQNLLRSARDNSDDEEKTALKRCADELAINLRNIAHAQDTDELRGLEGDAARRYFAQIATMIKPALREDFAFNGRNRRPPRDPVNALLSFLYALVLSDCRSALEAVGLDPQLGFLHTVRPGRPSLALDLLEEFRAPLADRLALTLINRRQLNRKDFDINEGSVLLSDEGRRTVLTAYQERKQETLTHPLLGDTVEIGLLPLLQARLLARHLRGDTEAYIPYLHK